MYPKKAKESGTSPLSSSPIGDSRCPSCCYVLMPDIQLRLQSFWLFDRYLHCSSRFRFLRSSPSFRFFYLLLGAPTQVKKILAPRVFLSLVMALAYIWGLGGLDSASCWDNQTGTRDLGWTALLSCFGYRLVISEFFGT